MRNFWEERYASEDFVYAKEPNAYFKQVIDTLPPGKLVLPGEGRGEMPFIQLKK